MKARWQARREASTVCEEESPENFWHNFNTEKNEIEKELKETVSTKLEDIQNLENRVRSLSASITPATSWLSAFDVKRATREAKEIDDKISLIKKKIAPRKKFGFSKRINTTNSGSRQHKDTEENKKSDILQKLMSERVGFFHQKDVVLCWEQSSTQVHLEELEDCIIFIPCNLTGLRMRSLKRCFVFACCVEGPAYVQDVSESQIRLVSRQLRIHNTTKTDFYVHLSTGPIIEDCHTLHFAKYALSWSSQNWQSTINLPLKTDAWSHVSDFKWLRPEASPNWSLLSDDAYLLQFPSRAAAFADRLGVNLLPAAQADLSSSLQKEDPSLGDVGATQPTDISA